MSEAELVRDEKSGGLTPAGPGWFVLNARDALWWRHEVGGVYTSFESREHRFEEIGFGIHVLEPGQPSAKYHREAAQEGFLVIHGECLLIVEEQERRMRAWDFFHCPPDTDHITIGGGDGPCALIMFGRRPGRPVFYPENELAARYGAQAPEPTDDPQKAYSDWPSGFEPTTFDWPLR